MEYRLCQGFWLESNVLTKTTAMIDAGSGNLPVNLIANGSLNRLNIQVTNDDASFTFTGRMFVYIYPRDGFFTKV